METEPEEALFQSDFTGFAEEEEEGEENEHNAKYCSRSRKLASSVRLAAAAARTRG